MQYISKGPHETEIIGEELYNKYKSLRVFALFGDLGAGKTAMTRGIARAAGCTDGVSSPTYTIVNEYRGKRKIAHFDMYRIADSDGLYEIGWEDYLDSGALCVVEWSENIKDALPKDTLFIEIEKISQDDRRITVSCNG